MNQPDMRHETPAITMPSEAFPDKIQLNGKAYISIQTVIQNQELYKVTMEWNQQKRNNDLILR